MMNWMESIENHQGLITAVATVVIALATVIYAILTRNLALENRLLRKAGTEPDVVAYLLPYDRYVNVINFVVANIGQGPARNVRFTLDADPDNFRFHNVRISAAEIRKPISILPQGEKMTAFFGMGPDLLKEPPLKPFVVRITCENIKGERQPERRFELDIAEFLGFSKVGKAPEFEIADALKKIADIAGHLDSGFKRLRVEVISTKEMERRDREFIEEARREMDRR